MYQQPVQTECLRAETAAGRDTTFLPRPEMDTTFLRLLEQLIVQRAEAETCFQRANSEPGLQHVMRIQRTILAGDVFRVPLRVTQLGTRIEWDFHVEPNGHDIRFGFVASGEDEHTNSILHTDEHSHRSVPRPGMYTLCFDNSHSMFTSKEVHCTVRMHEPQSQRAYALSHWLSEATETTKKATALYVRFSRRQQCFALDAATKRHVALRLVGLDAQQVKRMDEQFQRTERMRLMGPNLAVERANATQPQQAFAQTESDEERSARERMIVTEPSVAPAKLQARIEMEQRASNICIGAIERSRQRRAELDQARQRIHSLVSGDERTASAILLPAMHDMMQKLRECLDNLQAHVHTPHLLEDSHISDVN